MPPATGPPLTPHVPGAGGAGGKGVWGAPGVVYGYQEPDARDPNYDEVAQVRPQASPQPCIIPCPHRQPQRGAGRLQAVVQAGVASSRARRGTQSMPPWCLSWRRGSWRRTCSPWCWSTLSMGTPARSWCVGAGVCETGWAGMGWGPRGGDRGPSVTRTFRDGETGMGRVPWEQLGVHC